MGWERYNNNNSGVSDFMILPDAIWVRFKTGAREYLYEVSNIGQDHFDAMVLLAKAHQGLNAYIMHHVSNRYSNKH